MPGTLSGTGQVERERAVPNAISNLSNSVDYLSDSLTTLVTRLNPVKRNEPPMETLTDTDKSSSCEVADLINSIDYRVQQLRKTVDSSLSLLEV